MHGDPSGRLNQRRWLDREVMWLDDTGKIDVTVSWWIALEWNGWVPHMLFSSRKGPDKYEN